jgi:hypothetical protein
MFKNIEFLFYPELLDWPVQVRMSAFGWSGIKPSQPKWCLFGVYSWRVPKRIGRIGETLETRPQSTTDKAFKGNRLTRKNL